MRAPIILVSIFINAIISFGQTTALFQVTEGSMTDSIRKEVERAKTNEAIFEDDDYIVTSTCSGEWGGTVKFKSKRKGVVYACEATCVVSVNKINGKYIVTSYLAHMSGLSELIEIADPAAMEIYKPVPPRPVKGVKGKFVRYVGDDESHSTQGTKPLIDDRLSIMILASFFFNGKLHHIVSDDHKTYIAKIENGKLVEVQRIVDIELWSYDSEIVTMPNGHMMVPIGDGYLDIFGDQIKILQ